MTQVIFLADFPPLRPDPGLIFWTSVIFLLVYFVLYRMAFKPIQKALEDRDGDIQTALDQANLARQEMANLKAENEQLLIEAREERTKIIREANHQRDNIVAEARDKAREEAKRIVEDAKEQIDNQRMAAIVDIKNQVGTMAVDIAEKILRKKLDDRSGQESYAKTLVDEIKLN